MDRRMRGEMCARSLLLQSFWNEAGMQNLGFLFCLSPRLRGLYPDSAARRGAALRHMEFFNTQPYMASFVLGTAAAFEEACVAAPEERRPALEERLRQLKRAQGAALAAVGDAFFWGALRPAAAAWAMLVWLFLWTCRMPHPGVCGALFYLLIYNLPALWTRWDGLRKGYEFKEGLPVELERQDWRKRIARVRGGGLAAAILLACAALLVPPWGGPERMAGVSILAGCIGLRFFGVSSMAAYAGAVIIGVGAAAVYP
jgi:mannose PTS system EIID component